MKKLSTILLIAIFVLSLSACTPEKNSGGSPKAQDTAITTQSTQNNSGSQTDITRDKAIKIALAQVGVEQNDVRDFSIELDYERSKPIWEIEFEYSNREYSFDIDATTGEIIKNESEYEK